jgi:TrmH family RNA methyltransferase
MRTLDIGSKDNPTFRKLKHLLTSKGIKEEKSFFLMGEKLIQEFLQKPNPAFKIKNVIAFEGHELPILDSQIKLKKELFNELYVLGTHFPLLVLEYKDFSEFNFQEQPTGLEIILTHDSCHPYLPHSIKASAGAILNIPIHLGKIKMSQIPVTGSNVALDLAGQNIHEFKWNKNLRLLIGEEGPGIDLTPEQKKKIQFIFIPMSNQVESLNATVSASIAMWAWKSSTL